MRHIFLSRTGLAVALLALPLAACDTTIESNPNAATEQQVLTSTDGLLGLAVGTRRAFAVGPTSCLYNAFVADELSTRGLYVINTGNGDLAAVETGRGTLGPSNAITTNLFTGCSFVLKDAGLLIANAGNIQDASTQASVKVYGQLFKALAIGTMAAFYQQVPTSTVTAAEFLAGTRAGFKPRADALREAIALLRDAQNTLNGIGGAPSATFTARVGSSIDLKNTLSALIARYSLMVGDYDAAIAAAQAVDLTKRSTFTYDAQNPNPLFRSGFVSANVVGGVAAFGLPTALAPEAADARTAFYLGNANTTVRVSGFFRSDTDAIPVYLPGEMILIMAEAYARKNDLANAVTQLNRVRTKTAAQDAFGVGAGLPAYSGAQTQAAILTEIYRQRVIELYLQGLRLEDARRFGRPGPSSATPERNRTFYPFPQTERDNNASTPADPTAPEY
jgi:starch-binding outer membrane protein, SusD/RagB family